MVTRVAITESKLESESFLQNLQTSDWQTHFVCTQMYKLLWFQ